MSQEFTQKLLSSVNTGIHSVGRYDFHSSGA